MSGFGFGVTALTRHSGHAKWHGGVTARHASAACTIPGSPYAGGLVLVPHGSSRHDVTVDYGPWATDRELDSLTFIVAAPDLGDGSAAPVRVSVAVLDLHGEPLGSTSCVLDSAEERVGTVRFSAADRDVIHVRYQVSAVGQGAPPAAARFRYVLMYKSNALAELFNAAGSDKGTTCYAGKGVPHCYALGYESLMRPLMLHTFTMLEIGLQVRASVDGRGNDIPSLRVWEDLFPHATIYGLDVADFSFADGGAITTVRADQGSREELTAFLEAHRRPTFDLVIDDGSHASSDQQVSLAALFERVAPGGMYIIEDLNWQPREQSPRTLDVLRQVERGAPFASPFVTTEEAAYLNDAIDRVDILRPNDSEFAVIWKKESDAGGER